MSLSHQEDFSTTQPKDLCRAVLNFERKQQPIPPASIEIKRAAGNIQNLETWLASRSGQINPKELQERIQHLKKLNVTYTGVDKASGQEILIQYHDQKSTAIDETLKNRNPINPYESEIQALQYLQGMLLIQKYLPLPPETKADVAFQNAVNEAVEQFRKNLIAGKVVTDATLILAEKFAEIISKSMNVDMKNARKQVTMARDMALLLEKHPHVCTITEEQGPQSGERKLTAELARNGKVSPEYYDKNFKPPWLKYAKKYAGFKTEGATWLDKMFTDEAFMQQLKENGVPAPPSARWLPLPANYQKMQTYSATATPQHELTSEMTSDFIRLGTVCSFNLKNKELQEKLAFEQLKEVIRNELKNKINQFKKDYAGLIDDKPDFFVDYVNILSPIIAEEKLYGLGHTDNNAYFVVMAKKAMAEIQSEFSRDPAYHDVNLVVQHTNSAVNKWADSHKVKVRQFPEEKKTIENKIGSVIKLIDKIIAKEGLSGIQAGIDAAERTKLQEDFKLLKDVLNGTNATYSTDMQNRIEKLADNIEKGKILVDIDISDEARKDIATRIRAAFYLKQLMNKNLYQDIDKYQRNILKASFELLVQGKQSLKLLGCKSARDRTAVVMGAVKTMLSDKESMRDWSKLNSGILKSLRGGHHYRAVCWHVAIVKVSDVKKSLAKQLPKITQRITETAKAFIKTLGGLDSDAQKRLTKLQKETQKHQPQEVKVTAKTTTKQSSTVKSRNDCFELASGIITDVILWRRECGIFQIPTGVKEMQKLLKNKKVNEKLLDDFARISYERLEKSDSRKDITREFYQALVKLATGSTDEAYKALLDFRRKYPVPTKTPVKSESLKTSEVPTIKHRM